MVKKPEMPGRIGSHDHRLWQHTQRSHIPAHVGAGTRMDPMVCPTLWQVKHSNRIIGWYASMSRCKSSWRRIGTTMFHCIPVRDVTSENVTNLQANPKPKAKLMPAKTKSQSAPSYLAAIDMEEDGLEMLQEWELQQHLDGQTVTTTQADVMSLQFRMTNMESMIQQV